MENPTMAFTKSSIDFSETGLFSSLISDYLSGKEELRNFYQYKPELATFKEAIVNRKRFPFYRSELVNVLKQQNHQFADEYKLVTENIQALAKENTFTVTTGHQLCLFTGPLYFIYKIISTIKLAETLNITYPDYRFVPVYWMASEDHDFEEINHIHLFNKKVKWNYDATGVAGKLSTDSLGEVLNELRTIMGDGEHAKELDKLFEQAYLFNNNLADATRFLVYHLFGKYGLVVLDGNEKELKKLFIPVLKDELENETSFKLVSETSAMLEKTGYKPQVNPRNVNLFFLEEGVRERIVKAPDEHFEVLNTDLSFKRDFILNLLQTQPEHFSPNVVLRPLYQEYILPNLAYVGGPGELSYWLQYKKMFDYHQAHFPVLYNRNSILLVDANTNKKNKALGFSIDDFFKSYDELVRLYISRNSGEIFELNNEAGKIGEVFNFIKSRVIQIDQSLSASVDAEKQKLVNSLDTVAKKVNASIKRKHETTLNQISGLCEKIFPNETFQERHLNFIPFYLKYGKEFIDVIHESCITFSDKLIVIEEE